MDTLIETLFSVLGYRDCTRSVRNLERNSAIQQYYTVPAGSANTKPRLDPLLTTDGHLDTSLYTPIVECLEQASEEGHSTMQEN